MRWPSVLFMTVHSIAHFIVAFVLDVDNLAANWVGFQGFILASLLVFNVAVNLWDIKLRYEELLMKSEQILRLVSQCAHDRHLLKHWTRHSHDLAQARRLFTPRSPCVHQTITYRDDSCLNVPDYLLVRGDIIHLYPGDLAPAKCISLETVKGDEVPTAERKNNQVLLEEGCIFKKKEHYSDKTSTQDISLCTNIFMNSSAKLKRSHGGQDFLVLSTPYIKSLQITLQRSHRRPVNSVEKECFIISRKYFETFVVPSVFILSTIVTAIHYGYLDLTDSEQQIKTISIAYLLLRPSLTIMPFLPWMFPCFWMLVNAYGSARLLCCAETQRKRQTRTSSLDSTLPSQLIDPLREDQLDKTENLLATPNAASSSDQNRRDDSAENINKDVKFFDIFRLFIDLIIGKKGHVWRSSSLLQVLGSLTSLCVIDKVGILSWSNPTPEKVFVLTRKGSEAGKPSPRINSDQPQLSINSSLQKQPGSIEDDNRNHGTSSDDQCRYIGAQLEANSMNQQRSMYNNTVQPEVLDISQSFNTYHGPSEQSWIRQPNRVQFDDLNWRRYLNNLKPLGLAILMSNCCENSFADYFKFYKHINYESSLRCNHIPVVKRRCLCSLSNLIGFSKDIIGDYNYIRQIGAYKLSDSRSIQSGNIPSSIENTNRLKLPFSNLVSNLHRSTSTSGYQIFTQGTADIVLDACVEFWDGKELCMLDQTVRKKIMDFYHRTSLTSYCSAFSYSPVLGTYDLDDNYIEMPASGSRLSHQLRQLINEREEEHLQNQTINLPYNSRPKPSDRPTNLGSQLGSSQDDSQFNSLSSTPMNNQYFEDNHRPLKNQFVSTARHHMSCEDLLDCKVQARFPDPDSRFAQMSGKRKSGELDAALDEFTDQVFVGMVSLQYQACSDFVALVEQLEQACIRFIHFSKENELRSRVFSEKMGLESGWNCHISLQSDQDLDNAVRSDIGIGDTKSVIVDTEQVADTIDSVKHYFRLPPNLPSILFGNKRTQKVYAESSVLAHDREESSINPWGSLPSLFNRFLTNFSHSTPVDANQNKQSQLKSDSVYLPQEQKLSDVNEEHDHLVQPQAEATRDCIDNTEGFDSLAFDMSNRAKLPKGIENIRPHLETVDNIPLQVSLFTDCTPDLTKEMIEIMQDYGEIVCVIGSASSRVNTPVFLQANASIAIEPLMPQSCQKSCTKTGRRGNPSRRLTKRPSSSVNKLDDKRAEPHLGASGVNQESDRTRKRDRLGIGNQNVEQKLAVPKTNLKLLIDSDEYSGEASRSRYESSSRSRSYNSSSSSCLSSSSSSSSSSSTSSASKSYSSESSSSSSEDEADVYELNHSNDEELDHFGLSNETHCSLLEELPDLSSLATKLASLPCSYSYNRTEPVNLHNLIMEARHFTFRMKNTFVCMICFALSISSAQFLASILFLPPMLSSGLTIWLTVVVVPLMSFTLMNTKMDSQVMKIAVGKNLQLKPENITFFVICYLIKFIPSIIIVVFCFGLIIAHSCKLTGFGSSSLGPCWMFTYVQHSNTTSPGIDEEDLLWSSHLLTAQVCATFLMVLYFGKYSSKLICNTRPNDYSNYHLTNTCCIRLASRYFIRFCSQIPPNVAEKPH